MIGDVTDFVRRLQSVLPRGWLGDVAPFSKAVLSALATAQQSAFSLLGAVKDLTRIRSSSGSFLDLISSDFFGGALLRRKEEADKSYVLRILQELLRDRGTRLALETVLLQLTGSRPQIIEPARPADTGSYNAGGAGYSVSGAWGSLALHNRFFITAYRPQGMGIAEIAGFGTGGPLVYASLDMVLTPVADSDICNAVAAALPMGCTAWLRIAN